MNNINASSEWGFWLEHVNGLATKPNRGARSNYYFIFDRLRNKAIYASDSSLEILGYDLQDFMFLDIISFLHPEDYFYVIECERKVLEYFSTLSGNDVFRYNVSYSFRTKSASGQYINVKQNYQALEVNSDGIPTKVMVFHEVVNCHTRRSDLDFGIFDRQSNKVVAISNSYNLTKRETEIFDLIKEGYTSLEISNILFLSKFTVDTHRKNILAKTNSRRFIGMIKSERV